MEELYELPLSLRAIRKPLLRSVRHIFHQPRHQTFLLRRKRAEPVSEPAQDGFRSLNRPFFGWNGGLGLPVSIISFQHAIKVSYLSRINKGEKNRSRRRDPARELRAKFCEGVEGPVDFLRAHAITPAVLNLP